MCSGESIRHTHGRETPKPHSVGVAGVPFEVRTKYLPTVLENLRLKVTTCQEQVIRFILVEIYTSEGKISVAKLCLS